MIFFLITCANFFSAWLRTNCMQVFHYCAERLRSCDIFETCTDIQLRHNEAEKLGAKYNDFDNDPLDMLDEDEENTHKSKNHGENEIQATESVSQESLDRLFLKADEEDTFRWYFDHALFDTTSSRMSKTFRNKVYEIVSQWDDLDIFDDHLQVIVLALMKYV